MASPIFENYACINGDDDFNQFEVSEINGALLMSLLEESQGEVGDDDRLMSVIRSLEAEISPNRTYGLDSPMELEFGVNQEDYQLCNAGQVDGQDCSTSADLDFGWIDMELTSSSPSDDVTNWYMDPCGDEMDGIIEFGGVSDYSQIYYGVPLEEHGYNSLWQDTYDSVMYG
ncbi:hypothetical protein L1049_021386 [Liquidambar formosana]|uniref:Uncharacterized protein n=1 Tax=Liquidambar formosana TaxID=63359 RepID=A0AAP0R2V2_LIQFO